MGISTLEDVKNTLMNSKNDNYSWDTQRGHFSLVNPWFWGGGTDSRLQDDWNWVESCFVENTLAVISIWGAIDLQKPFSEYIVTYGEPDRITWEGSYNQRSAIWAEKGLLAVVDFAWTTPQVFRVILFPPIQGCELEESWLFEHLPKKGEKFGGDVIMNIPEVEDPFGQEKRLHNCQALPETP